MIPSPDAARVSQGAPATVRPIPGSRSGVPSLLRRLAAVLAVAVATGAMAQPQAVPDAADCGPAPPLGRPVRAAFYYPWWAEKWHDMERGGASRPEPRFLPDYDGDGVADFYSVDSDAVVDRQIAAMKWGHIDAGISSWWGVGTVEDIRFVRLLERARHLGFRWCIYYEPEGRGDPDAARIASDLLYLYDRYALEPTNSRAYLTVCGRPVVFVYNPTDGCGVTERWHRASDEVERLRGVRPYVVLHEVAGEGKCRWASEFSWHRYCPARGRGAYSLAKWSFTVRPAYWGWNSPVEQPRDLSVWAADVAAMASSRAAWQLVCTFNEWIEGSAVEAGVEWRSPSGFGSYLDVLHAYP